jgi:hypothetical protein
MGDTSQKRARFWGELLLKIPARGESRVERVWKRSTSGSFGMDTMVQFFLWSEHVVLPVVRRALPGPTWGDLL